MNFLSRILKDIADECTMPEKVLWKIWERILLAVKQRKLEMNEQDTNEV